MLRNVLRTILGSGLVAAIGYLLMARRRRRMFFFATRRPLFRRDLRDMLKMGRSVMRAMTR